MKKNVFGRRFKRDRNERKALFRSLISSLIIYGKIETTEEKAKAIKAEVDKLITKAKKGGTNLRLLDADVFPNAVEKLKLEIAPSFKNRHGGYTRIIRKGKRLSDNASVVVMEFVERETVAVTKPVKAKKPKATAKKTKKVVKPTVAKTKVGKKEKKNVKKTK